MVIRKESSLSKSLAATRPKDDIAQLRVRYWFYLVVQQSGLTATELEAKYAVSESKRKQIQLGEIRGSRVWEKYRAGQLSPRRERLDRVNFDWPGTRKWFLTEIWRLMDEKSLLSPEELRSKFKSLLPESYQSLIFLKRPYGGFWRDWDVQKQDGLLALIESDIQKERAREAALTATYLLIQEARIVQDKKRHKIWRDLANRFEQSEIYNWLAIVPTKPLQRGRPLKSNKAPVHQ